MATFTWSGTTTGPWSTGLDWSPAGPPAIGSDVVIGSATQLAAFTVTEDTTVSIASLTLAGASGGKSTTLAFATGNTLTVSGAVATNANTVINGTGTLVANGAIAGGGAITASSGLLVVTGSGSLASGGGDTGDRQRRSLDA